MKRPITWIGRLWICFLYSFLLPCDDESFQQIIIGGKSYPLYPSVLSDNPGLSSPIKTKKGIEIITGRFEGGGYCLFPVTIKNGAPLNYRQSQIGKGRQLDIDGSDFPTLAKTGLHDENELSRTESITGRSVMEITRIARPMEYSRAGFMGGEEDIISVLKQDNHRVNRLGLTHIDTSKPLFHLWNLILAGAREKAFTRQAMGIESILYYGKWIRIDWEGGKGWQESIFNDEILGRYHLMIKRELDTREKKFLRDQYPGLSEKEMSELISALSSIHTGEMVPYYIRRYGFYEGHTSFRADPIAIAFIFNLKNLEEIESAFPGKLFRLLTPFLGGGSPGGGQNP